VSPIGILIVDDSKAFREFVAAAVQQGHGLEVVGEATNGLDGVQKAEELRPHEVLLDIGLPKLNGIQACRLIRKCAPESRVVFLSAQTDLDVVNAALDADALGYIQKIRAARDLMPAVKAALNGMQFVSRELNVPVFDIFAGLMDKDAALGRDGPGAFQRTGAYGSHCKTESRSLLRVFTHRSFNSRQNEDRTETGERAGCR